MCLLAGCGSGQAAARTAATAVVNSSEIPCPISATVGTTGMPRSFSRDLTLMCRPLFHASSIMFSAMTIGRPSWDSSSVSSR